MNAVEIEEAVSRLAEAPFDPAGFPYAFLEAFGNKETTIKRLRSGDSNQSDLPGGVLQRSNIHLKVCAEGEVTKTLDALRQSPATSRQKAKFILATDGKSFEAENLVDGGTVVCAYPDFHDHFGFFLPLAGITTVRQISENAFDIKATGRLNRLYIELLKDNPEWATAARREDLNHFMARLIFCFFAEDTGIFHGQRLFTSTIEQMSARDSSDTHLVLSELFRAMNTKLGEREAAKIKSWANGFPYVNGGLFSDSIDTPRFSKIARSYLLHVGNLDWTKINPDIFGSMIQAVADDEERGALGMHYTSVPNILKVLNPLFLDELRARLAEAGDNPRKLLNLRSRLARIRLFDPACGSGNFLVIAYKELRALEAEINRLRGEADRHTEIPLTNFRGIELRHFSCEIARLALIIAEYQCDVHYRGERLALAEFLPLQKANWITCGNALRLDWLSVCPPTDKAVKLRADDLFETPLDQAEIDFKNEGGETYICGNPPYQGSVNQTVGQKQDMADVFSPVLKKYKDLDYVAAFLLKAARYNQVVGASSGFVTTNSVTQGEQVAMLWPLIFELRNEISFAHTSFLWSNLASNKAVVSCVIIGLSANSPTQRKLFSFDEVRIVSNISPYLVPAESVIVTKRTSALSALGAMQSGNKPTDGGHLILGDDEKTQLAASFPDALAFVKRYVGSKEIINGNGRWCLWIEDDTLAAASAIPPIRKRINAVRQVRSESRGDQANDNATTPHRFVFAPHTSGPAIAVPNVSSERRDYLTPTPHEPSQSHQHRGSGHGHLHRASCGEACFPMSRSRPGKSRPLPASYPGLVGDIGALLDTARRSSARAVNALMTATYWEIGRRIVEFEQGGERRAGYGEELLSRLADDLTARFGRGFSVQNLENMRLFYGVCGPSEISQTLSRKSALALPVAGEVQKSQTASGKWQTRSAKSSPFDLPDLARAFPLPWSHYVLLIRRARSPEAFAFYHAEALRGGWSVRQLQRQIDSQFYERTALSRNKTAMLANGAKPQPGDAVSATDEIRHPLVLEFLGLRDEYSETDLEAALIQHLEAFLVELGNDFAFVGRQRRLRIDDEWFRVDLLFFHRRLRCLVIIDLKLGRFTHADAGQMHLYLNYAREHWVQPGENPPVGIVLCSGKSEALVRYATEALPNKLLVREYLTALPDEEVLSDEIVRTRRQLEARGGSR